MKILVGSALDAMNLALENILKELMARGHQIEVLAYNIDSGNTWMFENLKISFFLVKDLTQKKIKQFDIAFCCEDMVPLLLHSNIYIFSYNPIPDTWNGAGSDFMFTMARDRKIRWREDCAVMPIGGTKNDVSKFCTTPKKQFLYIDAGHNPFGEKGKQQVADMLLTICRVFPDYDVVVKPRWLPNEHTTQTHRSGLHIYKVLDDLTGGQLPDNLILLNEHRNLQELIDESTSVITTSINCWFDVGIRGKGCIVVDGFDAEEQFETRPSFRDSYKVAKRAGCCARYNEVVKYLPNGLKCDGEYLQRRIPYKSGASSRIVDVIEYVYYNFLVQGTFPAIREYDFETYKTDIIADPKLSLKELKYNRFKNGVCSHFLYNQFDFIRDPIDDSPYFQLAKDIYRLYPLNEEGFHQLRDKMISERRRIIIDNAEICMRDDISQSILLMELYGDGQYDKILTMPQEHIQCVGPYHYYLGLIYRDRGQIFTAIYYFRIFLKEATARLFNKYPQESNWGISTAYNYVFHFYDGENIPPDEFLGLYASLYEQRDIEIVAFDNRKRAHNWLPNVAKQLANDDPVRALKCLQLYAEWEYHYNIQSLEDQLKTVSGTKLYRFGARVKWILRKLEGGVRCLQKHGWKYTFFRSINKINSYFKKKIGGVAPIIIYKKFCVIKRGFDTYSRLMKSDEGQFIALAPFGTGDIYVIAHFYQPYLAAYWKSPHPPTFVVAGKGSKKVADMCLLPNCVNVEKEENIALIWLWYFLGDSILHGHFFHWGLAMNHTGIIRNLEGLHGYNMFSFYKYAVFNGIEEQKPFMAFPESIDLIEFMQERQLIPGKTVLLVPYSPSAPWRPVESFWITIADRLRRKGYSVCTNVGSDFEKEIPGTKAVSLPYEYVIPFLNIAGYMISVRTGFADITESANCKRIIIYPKFKNIWSHIASYHEMFSINQMYGRDSDIEMEYEVEKAEKIIMQIIDQFE